MIAPSTFAQSIFTLNNAPLVLPQDSMRHLYPIYNRPAESILLKFGRQTHKSTTVGYKLALTPIKYESYHALYVAPTGNQVSVFSSDKLDSALNGSTVVKDYYFDTKTKNQISYKELRNNSKIYLRSAFHTADSIRGISADQTCIDEMQDIISDHIPVIEQCMSHSLAKWDHLTKQFPELPMHLFNNRMYAGTPKTVENAMEKYWAKSTQNEWIIKCQNQGCKKYNYINEYNIGDLCLICNKCGKPIYYEDGQWIVMNTAGIIEGYRLPQIVLKWINNIKNPKSWQISVINTRKIYSIEKYFNEVLALPYAAAKHPMSAVELKACCDEDWDQIEESQAFKNPKIHGCIITAGIDWGKGDTASGTSYSVLTISAFVRGVFRTVFIKKYTGRMSEPLIQVKDMLRIINRFGVQLTIADTGDGRTSNAMMVDALGADKFAEIYEHGTMKKKIAWDGDKGYYIINRTQVMTDYIMEIKKTKVRFFSYEQFKEYLPDFTGIYADYSEQTRMTKYDHNVPDDTFHSWMFSRIGSGIIRGELSHYLSGGVQGDGTDSSPKSMG